MAARLGSPDALVALCAAHGSPRLGERVAAVLSGGALAKGMDLSGWGADGGAWLHEVGRRLPDSLGLGWEQDFDGACIGLWLGGWHLSCRLLPHHTSSQLHSALPNIF